MINFLVMYKLQIKVRILKFYSFYASFLDGHQSQGGQQYNSNDYYLKQQAARMLSAIQKGCKFGWVLLLSLTN